jgi:hypothetical protein
MKEIIWHLPDKTYGQLMAEAASAHMSVEMISTASAPKASMEASHMLLTAVLTVLGFRSFQPEKA